MTGRIDARLLELGIELPDAPAPVASYVPFVITGPLVFISGQVTMWNGELKFIGRLGEGIALEEGREAARICGLNLIAQVRAACDGDLDRVKRCVKLTIYVNSTNDFTDQPKVANGASDLMSEVFGDAGRHARAAIGVNTLPLGCAVEAEAVFEIA